MQVKKSLQKKIFCQSCGLPLKKDVRKGGTYQDGSKSTKYCSTCFENGKFTMPDIDVKEMQKMSMKKLVDKKTTKIAAWLMTRAIPTLERWRREEESASAPH